jgi:hypothetical protein
MKKTSFLVSILFCLAVLCASHPGLAGSSEAIPEDLLMRMEEAGWEQIQPGVLQRGAGDGAVETFGFGDAGLRFKLEEMKEHLAFLRKEYERHPSRELRRTIRSERTEILRTAAALKRDGAGGSLESSRAAITAWSIDECLATYNASAYAFPLAGGTGASAKAFFKNDCGDVGEVYVTTSATTISADHLITTVAKKDPPTAEFRSGSDISAAASLGANGVSCYSYAAASVTGYNPAFTYFVKHENGNKDRMDGKCSGSPNVQPFAADAASNLKLPGSPPVHPDSAAMVTNLNSGQHKAHISEYGRTIYNAAAGTPRTIVCTRTWGTCGLSSQPVPVNASWKPASGSEGAMTVIDYTNRKIYDFYQVVTNTDGTVKINADGTVTTGWGEVTDLDGSGHGRAVSGSNLSYMLGTIRAYEMERSAGDPANAIQHALAFTSSYACDTHRYPATKSNGTSTAVACIPVGSRVFLDGSADCSMVSPVGEKAICYTLQKYGAYLIGTGGQVFGLKFEIATSGHPGGSGPDPYPGVGIADNQDLANIPWSRLKVANDCQCSSSSLILNSGRPFAEKAAANLPLPSSPSLDPNSAAIVANLNSERHKASLYEYGKPVFDASAGTPRTILCTKAWGTCGVSLQPVPIDPSWKPSSGSSSSMSVIDYEKRKVYDFYQVPKNPDGTVVINPDGTVSVGWGSVADLDGNGLSPGMTGADLSHLFGTVRVFEMERAASDPANAIRHALVFHSQYACNTYRYPATNSNGTSTAAGCIPQGARVFLDSAADCSTVSPVGEKAVCYALQKYGAYMIGTGGSVFEIKFEVPTSGQPGGSGPDPYPGVGFVWDAYDMANIPWSRLKVAKDCQCTPY